MSYPIIGGSPTLSGNFIPEVWSGKTLIKFYESTIFSDIANTDYEGEISQHGDKVKIRTIPNINIKDYIIDMDLNYEKQAGGVVDLLIDKGKYYAFPVNVVEEKQADINYVDKWTEDAGQQLAINIDREILSDIYVDAHAKNKGATAGKISGSYNMGSTGAPVQLQSTTILNAIVDMGSILDEQNVPHTDRWLVLPASFCGMIKKSDLKDASLTGDAKSPLRNGLIGSIDRFKIYNSNNLAFSADTVSSASVSVCNTMAGHKSALTFASQLVENEVIPNPKDFGKLMRGLQVYGYKVLKPESLVHGYFYK